MARDFDAASSQYLVNNNAVVTGPPLTMAIWFNTDDLSVEYQSLLSIHDSSYNYFALSIHAWGGTNDLTFRARGSAIANAMISYEFAANTWYHLCGVTSAVDNRALYLDGGSKVTNTTTSTVSSLSHTYIARRDAEYFAGRLAEAAIWNIALTDAQVAMLALGARPTFVRPDALVAYWPLLRTDQDLVGGYDMTATNSPTQGDHPPKIWYPVPATGFWLAGGASGETGSVTFARVASHAQSANADGVAATTFAKLSGDVVGAEAGGAAGATLARNAAVAQQAAAAGAGDATLAKLAGDTAGAEAGGAAGATLARNAAVAQQATAAGAGDATLAKLAGDAVGATAQAVAQISVGRIALLTADWGAGAFSAFVTLAVAKGTTASGGAASDAALLLDAVRIVDLSTGSAFDVDLALSMTRAAGLQATVAARGGVGLSLAQAVDVLAAAAADAGVTVQIAAAMRLSATSVVVTTGTPASRTVTVAVESRTVTVAAESRTVTVAAG